MFDLYDYVLALRGPQCVFALCLDLALGGPQCMDDFDPNRVVKWNSYLFMIVWWIGVFGVMQQAFIYLLQIIINMIYVLTSLLGQS